MSLERKARDTEFGMIKKGSSFIIFFIFFHVNTSLVILRYSIYFNFLDAFAIYISYRYIRKKYIYTDNEPQNRHRDSKFYIEKYINFPTRETISH